MRRILTPAVAFLLAAAPLAVGQAPDAPTKKKGGKAAMKLAGGYTIVKGESDGAPIPAAKIEGAIVKFTDDTVVGTDKEKKELFVSKYKLDPSAKPWKITMTSKAPGGDTGKPEVSTTGLIKKEGDTIVIIYALPGGPEPTDFKTSKGQNMFWLENKNK